jgi:endoglucanase
MVTKLSGKPMRGASVMSLFRGKLQVQQSSLCDQNGEKIQLRGISTHGMQWFGNYVNRDVITWLKEDWHIIAFRIAMYTGENGYISQPHLKEKVKEAVEICISLDLYVIIDWHILSDNNPNMHKEEAKAFFAEMAGLYHQYPHVIYEICNEPNGEDVTWEKEIRPYAVEIIDVIRSYDKQNLILVGTGTWSQDVHHAADHPLDDTNVMYTAHFYAGTHGEELRDKIRYALNKNVGVFVSEWGTTLASGDEGVYLDKSDEWLSFLDEHGISWFNWNLADHPEDSAVLVPGASVQGHWEEKDLKPTGKYVREKLRSYSK